LIKLC